MNNKGFTLIELVLVISVMLVLSAFVVPGVLSYQELQNEEINVNQTINLLRNLQISSLTKDVNSYFSITRDSINLCEDASNPNSCRRTNFSKDFFLNETVNIYFSPFGDTMINNTLIGSSIALETKNYNITINRHGGIEKVKK